ncbi:9960_t:CDS:2, partial [Gigaspora rosea]
IESCQNSLKSAKMQKSENIKISPKTLGTPHFYCLTRCFIAITNEKHVEKVRYL